MSTIKGHPMSFAVRTRVEEGLAIVQVEGAMTLSPALQQLREAVRNVLKQSKIVGLVLDTSEVTATDSAGLGELTVVSSYAANASCPLVLIGVRPNLRTMLEVTHLDGLLPAAEDLSAARVFFAQA